YWRWGPLLSRTSLNSMLQLLHHKLDPSCRLIRLMLAEYGVGVSLVETSPWRRDPDFLAINPAASVPVMLDEPFPPIIGVLAAISHIEDNFGPEAHIEAL